MIHVSWYDADKNDWDSKHFNNTSDARHFAAFEAPRPNITSTGTIVYRVPYSEGIEVIIDV